MQTITPSTTDKDNAVNAAIQTLEKRFGRNTILSLNARPVSDVPAVSTTSPSLDLALGIGGLPRGRIVEVFGPESSGKTTLALHVIAEVQRTGGRALFIDAEHALDVGYAKLLGVDVDTLLVSQPDSGEQALEIAETMLRSGGIDLIVVDSVAALVPQAEIEGQMGDAHMGLQARLMSQALRKMTAIISRANTLVLFINQVRQKIGVTFGNGETTTGGNALKFYATVRLDIRRIGSVQDGGNVIGNKTRIKIVKNKLAPPFKQVEVDLVFGRGLCRAGDLLQLAEQNKLVDKSGSWYSLGDLRLGNGRERVRERLLAEPDLMAQFEALVRAKATVATTAEA